MRTLIILLILTLLHFEITLAQNDSITKKKCIVISNQLGFFYIIPNKLSINVSTANLNSNIRFSYCNNFYSTGFDTPGFEFGYTQYIFKKFGIKMGANYEHYFGDFTFIGDNAKYEGYTKLNELQLITTNLGFYYRFKSKKYGIIEPSVNVNYIYPIKKIYDDYMRSNFFIKAYLSLELKYYFKKNKPKLP